ncbi:hypothetical protein ACH4SP_00590 [Streptomyces sp. NPDC021093]|uniref:hypothetical protein n=1 Tax=Streptomyces sp. NPDC021093 TaxID=3365112 RepID=UPI00379F4907
MLTRTSPGAGPEPLENVERGAEVSTRRHGGFHTPQAFAVGEWDPGPLERPAISAGDEEHLFEQIDRTVVVRGHRRGRLHGRGEPVRDRSDTDADAACRRDVSDRLRGPSRAERGLDEVHEDEQGSDEQGSIVRRTADRLRAGTPWLTATTAQASLVL